jgi:succinate dehydrogenase/fumarate reductase-like Fe-S protein
LNQKQNSITTIGVGLQKIQALLFLGCHFVKHGVRRLFRISRRGRPHFLKDYAPDGIFAVSPSERRGMPDYSRCVMCRLCDGVCPEISVKSSLLAPSYVVAGFARSLTDFHWFSRESFVCRDCQACEDACPQHVPIRKMVEFMEGSH